MAVPNSTDNAQMVFAKATPPFSDIKVKLVAAMTLPGINAAV